MYFMRSVGDYGPWSGTLETEIQPLLEEYGVHMYVCGHDHNLQHLHHQNDTGEFTTLSQRHDGHSWVT